MAKPKSDSRPGNGTSLVPGTGGDVLVLSMRRIDDLVAYCTPYEFEDVVADIAGADTASSSRGVSTSGRAPPRVRSGSPSSLHRTRPRCS
jgi:hypothetical protein